MSPDGRGVGPSPETGGIGSSFESPVRKAPAGSGGLHDPAKDDFADLLSTIERSLDICCSRYKEEFIRRRLMVRMSVVKKQSYGEYLAYLCTHPDEEEALRNALTINVTKFFRDPDVFSLFRREIIPGILKGKKRIRIWSAGCSSGEEPYSYAMILSEAGTLGKPVAGTIYATDIDREILDKAKAGVYGKSALENLTPLQIRRHFTLLPDGRYEVRPHLKSFVRFLYHDLMKGEPVSRYFDIISCRNVTIYFNEGQRGDLFRTFHEGLVPEGYYVMGLSEYLGKEGLPFFRPCHPQQKVFSRI
jgi:chemotaxis protein methyltransferase CheR